MYMRFNELYTLKKQIWINISNTQHGYSYVFNTYPLTHCSILAQYVTMDLSQYWLRSWCLTATSLYLNRYCLTTIHVKAKVLEKLVIVITAFEKYSFGIKPTSSMWHWVKLPVKVYNKNLNSLATYNVPQLHIYSSSGMNGRHILNYNRPQKHIR